MAATASEVRVFAIPAGQLGDALIALGSQASITIGINDEALAKHHTSGLHGRYSVPDAVRHLLADSGADFTLVDGRTIRVFKALAPLHSKMVAPVASANVDPVQTIVVTASKQNTPLAGYPGTVHVVKLDPGKTARSAAGSTPSIIDHFPEVSSTSLGAGRDKLFIRGIADSSFNGPSQSTVGLYLGDVRLTYSAPDPNLNLYDIGSVEILEGAQGTLYGTGSIGGIIRFVPNPPDPSHATATFAAGGIATADGGGGGDLAAMLNLPLKADRLAVRLVGYGSILPGYIDDPKRGLHDINRNSSEGGRIAIAYQPDDDWTVTLGGAAQYISTNDGQYALRGQPRLTHHTNFAEPFDNDYRLAYISLSKHWNDVDIISTTAAVWHAITTRFDATGFAGTTGPIEFDEASQSTLVSHETRLTNHDGERPWLAGVAILHDAIALRRSLGPVNSTVPIAGIRNEHFEGALFGQYSLPIMPGTMLVLGGRATYSRSGGELLDEPLVQTPLPSQAALRLAPTIALSWQANDRSTIFARVQKADRSAGVEVAPTGNDDIIRRYDGDDIVTAELGFRLSAGQENRFSGGATLSAARWNNIQADLIDTNGLPYTENIGDGRVYGLDAQLYWRPAKAFTVEASTFLNRSRLDHPAPAYAATIDRELPNVAEAGVQLRGTYGVSLTPSIALTVDGSVRYIGRSKLGIGYPLDVPQGNFTEINTGAHLAIGRWGLSFDIQNLGNVYGNRFSYGNPFGLSHMDQITPLRPRTVRVGVDARF